MSFYQDLDNYILVIAAFIAAVAYTINDVTISFVVLAVGLLLKAIASAWYEGATVLENVDNIALAIAGVLALLATVTGNQSIALYLVVAGGFIKAIASAWTRGSDLATNIDNILLALGTALSTAFIALGYPQVASIAVMVASLLKGLLSTYFRNKATPTVLASKPVSV